MNKPEYFVYITTNGQTFPQLWYDDQMNGNGQSKFKDKEIVKHKLTEREKLLSLDDLMLIYPYKEPQ